MLDWLKTKTNFLQVDVHSHLIPSIDDGVENWEEAIELITKLADLGYQKLITTPHVIHNYYPNKPDQIRKGVEQLNMLVSEKGLSMSLEAGAEYFVDEHFAEQVKSGEELLTFGDQYILIETPFMNKPICLEEVIFDLQSKGLKPILAHPERYTYLQNNFEQIHQLIENGTLFQININSFSGYYSNEAKTLAKALVDHEYIHFLGSDIHNSRHLSQIQKSFKTKLFQKCRQLELHNSSL